MHACNVITEARVGNSFANYPIHIQILCKTKNNKEKDNKIEQVINNRIEINLVFTPN